MKGKYLAEAHLRREYVEVAVSICKCRFVAPCVTAKILLDGQLAGLCQACRYLSRRIGVWLSRS